MKKCLAPLQIPRPKPDTMIDQFCACAEEQTQSDSEEEQVQHQHADGGVARGGRVKLVARDLSAAAPAAPAAPAASAPTFMAPVAPAPMAFTAPVAPPNRLLGANIRTASASTPQHPPSHLNGVRVVTASADVFGQRGPLGQLGQGQGQGQGQSSAAPTPAYVAPAPVAMQAVVQVPVVQQSIAKVPADDYDMIALRPALERMDILEPIEAYVAARDVDIDTLFIRQQRGGPDNGMFNAKDPIAAITGMTPSEANKWVKLRVGPEGPKGNAKGFMSRKYIDTMSESAVILLNFVLYSFVVLM